MVAPTLLLLAPGDDRSATMRSAAEFRSAMQTERPDLDVRLAHVTGCLPSIAQTLNKIVRAGAEEVIVVGLDLADSAASQQTTAVVAKIAESYPRLKVIAARDFGPEPALLNVVDQRLRRALARAKVTELDGLVLAAPGNADRRAQAKLSRCARQWSQHHRLPVMVSSTSSGLSTAGAVNSLRADGRRHIATGSWFFTSSALWEAEREAALAAGAVAVAEPIGPAEESIRIVLSRYAFAAMDLLDAADTGAEQVKADSIRDEAKAPHLRVVSA